MLFEEIVDDYMEHSRRTKRSHNNDRIKAERFLALFRGRMALDVTTKEIEDFRAKMMTERTVATVNHHLKFLKAVYNPVTAASIPDFRFHDLRHTFASRLAMRGVDLYTVQRAGGWKTTTMVQRYAHLSPDHMRAAVEKLTQDVRTVGTGTKTGTLDAAPSEERRLSVRV